MQTQQLPLMQWELGAQTDLAIDTAFFPQQERARLSECFEAADVFDSNAALWSTERAGDPFAGTTPTALDYAAMCQTSNAAMYGTSDTAMTGMGNTATTGMSNTAMNEMHSAGIYGFSDTAMNTAESMPTVMFHGTPVDTYSAPASIQSTFMCINFPIEMLQDPAPNFADSPTLGLFDSTTMSLSNNTAMSLSNSTTICLSNDTAASSSSWSTANGSIRNEPLDSPDFPSKRSAARQRRRQRQRR
jgi:hypothetical protein